MKRYDPPICPSIHCYLFTWTVLVTPDTLRDMSKSPRLLRPNLSVIFILRSLTAAPDFRFAKKLLCGHFCSCLAPIEPWLWSHWGTVFFFFFIFAYSLVYITHNRRNCVLVRRKRQNRSRDNKAVHLNTPPLTDGLLVSEFWFIAEMECVHGWWMQNRLYTQLLLEGNCKYCKVLLC